LIVCLQDRISVVFYLTSLSWPREGTPEIEYPTWQVIEVQPDMPLVGEVSLHVWTLIETMIQCSDFYDVNLRALWSG
jgi:hypothetical protein